MLKRLICNEIAVSKYGLIILSCFHLIINNYFLKKILQIYKIIKNNLKMHEVICFFFIKYKKQFSITINFFLKLFP